MKSISILGCGWLGEALAVALIRKNYEVKGSTTSKYNLEKLKTKGIIPYLIDIKKQENNITDFLASKTLIIAITSKNMDGFKNLIYKLEKYKMNQVVFISSTSVYPNTNGIVTENTFVNKSILFEIESLFRENLNFNTTIVRFGGLFGYDRKPGNFIKGKVKNPEGYINFIHRDDCVQIIEKIISYNICGETLNACADTHPKRRAFYKKELNKIGNLTPEFDEEPLTSYKIISSEKLKTMLGYQFKYPNLMEYS